ncbi:MAG: DUF4395 domain-containing protein [Longimicrobiales bacterium]|nr:DUF4395 domain-containing protein [Longimicrobiales bacterium]
MRRTISEARLRRLDIQGFDSVERDRLAQAGPWLRMAFGLCATLALLGTATASTVLLGVLAAIAFTAALSPVHPFDLLYNHGIRHLRGTPPLPGRGAPSRFACGLGSVWLLLTIWAFESPASGLGYALGFTLVASATLVTTTDVCIPSMIYRAIFGPPRTRSIDEPPSSQRTPSSSTGKMASVAMAKPRR